MGFAEAKRAARQLPPRGLCAAWAWAAAHRPPSPAAAAQAEPDGRSRDGGGGGDTWMTMDVPANLAAAGLPAALAMAGLGGAGSASGWQQEAGERALALPRLLVVDSEGRGRRCGPDGVHGAAACAVGRLLAPDWRTTVDMCSWCFASCRSVSCAQAAACAVKLSTAVFACCSGGAPLVAAGATGWRVPHILPWWRRRFADLEPPQVRLPDHEFGVCTAGLTACG